MATAAPAPGATPTGEYHLHRKVGLRALTMVSLGSIIGSGWLLGALHASEVAGAASSLSWLLGGLVLAVLALVHAELGSTYPVSGGTARFPYMVFGGLGGFTGGWMAFLQAVTIAPIEVEASAGYINAKWPSLGWTYSKGLLGTEGALTPKGIGIGAVFMLVFTIFNIMGVKWLAETNAIATYWKILIPTITIFALLFTVFHSSNFKAGGGFMPFGVHGMFAALPLGIIFALEGFEQAIQVGGETENPQRNIPRAVIGAMIIGTLIYLLLDVAFIGAINPANVAHGWSSPITTSASAGPYYALASSAGLGWLATLLIIDSVVSPAGTGLVYLGTSSRLSYGLGRNGYFPKVIAWIDRRGVPIWSILICFVIGMLTFLPFPSWGALVSLVTAATVLMYAFAPLALAGLRRSDPDRPRAYKLPAAKVLCPLSFIFANCIIYFAGWSNVFWLYVLIVVGFIIFGLYQAAIPAARRTVIDWKASWWVFPWLVGLGIISWQGQYTTEFNTVFGITLNPTLNIGGKHTTPVTEWYDLIIIAVFSLVIYYIAVWSAMSTEKIQAAVEEVEQEASIELESHLLTAG
jgi:amino acid transporter